MNGYYFTIQFKMSSHKIIGHMQCERRWGEIRVKDLPGGGEMEKKRKLEYVKDLYENTQAWELFTNIIC